MTVSFKVKTSFNCYLVNILYSKISPSLITTKYQLFNEDLEFLPSTLEVECECVCGKVLQDFWRYVPLVTIKFAVRLFKYMSLRFEESGKLVCSPLNHYTFSNIDIN